jgi:septation ring formation regulator EzrA
MEAAKNNRRFEELQNQIRDLQTRLVNVEQALTDAAAEKEKYKFETNASMRALLDAAMESAKVDMKQYIQATVQSSISRFHPQP